MNPIPRTRKSAVPLSRAEAASTLLITMITCGLLGTVLCSYLVLITHRNTSAMRAMAWNSAVPVLEAGIEEALTHLHEDQKNPTANNWNSEQVNGRPVYWKYREFPDGSYYYVTNFNIRTRNPTIYSAGYVRTPLSDHKHISRLVRVTTTN